jgi:hypothetical protein
VRLCHVRTLCHDRPWLAMLGKGRSGYVGLDEIRSCYQVKSVRSF